jgi:glycosyltransferase involved in cell wall biosynthesis
VKALFLYTELAAYILNCCEKLSLSAEVHIVRWPVNKEAPFKFSPSSALQLYDRKTLSDQALIELTERIAPDIIVCSGWIDKGYLKACRRYAGKIPVVLTMDTRWRGAARQWLATIAARLFLKKCFTHAWVPGNSQRNYAQKLGFATDRIFTGFYCCDLEFFNDVYENSKQKKESGFPKRFIYTGRYYEFKGVTDLWQAFAASGAVQRGWELWCIGTGSVAPEDIPGIRHFGFVQPHEFPALMSDAGVFILPSRFEPWGVVVHEFAAAGFPMLLSDAVGASEQFLEDGSNGYAFMASDPHSLAAAMKKIMDLPANNLLLMGSKSHVLAQQVSPAKWVNTLTGIYSKWHEEKNPDHRRRR